MSKLFGPDHKSDLFPTLFDHAAASMAVVLDDGTFLMFNRTYCEFLGYSEAELLQLNVLDVTFPEDRELTAAQFRAGSERKNTTFQYEKRYLRKDGGLVWGLVSGSWVIAQPGTIYGVALIQDITARKESQISLRESDQRLRAVFENAAACINTIAPSGAFLQVNRACCQFFGYTEEELLGMTVEEVTHPDDLDLTRRMFLESLAGTPFLMHYEKRFRHKDGTTLWGLVSSVWQLDEEGTPSYAIGLVQDITQRRKAEKELLEREVRLDFLAHHDPLTQLPNRLLFQDRLEHAMAKARRGGTQVALLFLDLDRFKKINDSLGHQMGDQVLCQVADALRGVVRKVDTLARLGGDEFTVVLERVERVKEVVIVAERVLEALSRPIAIEQHRFHVSTSIGISLFPDDGQTVETLMKAADVAMYRAKDLGRNAYQFYTPDLNARSGELLLLENGLCQALELDQLELYYQPQFDLGTGRMVAAEALLRWRHPELGMIAPADFIPLAEETGLILSLGEWVLRKACAQAQGWRKRGETVRVAVNVSGRQFLRSDLIGSVQKAVEETGFDPALLELEITESIIIKDVDLAVKIMQELNRMGVQIAIDDFGTGYSSLNYLQQFAIQRLKIDMSFIRKITATAKGAAIVNAIIALAKELRLEVVAEGIETEAQLEFLRQRGCDCGQGYLLGRPAPHLDLTLAGRGKQE